MDHRIKRIDEVARNYRGQVLGGTAEPVLQEMDDSRSFMYMDLDDFVDDHLDEDGQKRLAYALNRARMWMETAPTSPSTPP